MSPKRISFCWLLLATVGATACVEGDAGTAGSLRVGVLGEDAQGNIYRLRDGEFDLEGASTHFLSTEDLAEPVDALSAVVAAGDYTVTLQDGWRLERFDPATEVTLDVDALLNSANPVETTVGVDATTSVAFQFLVEDAGPVTLGEGAIEIDIEVEPIATTCDPLLQDCAAGEGCYPIGEPGALQFTCAQAFGGGPEQSCDQANDCAPGLTCVENAFCVGGGSCCLSLCGTTADCDSIVVCQPLDASTPGVGFCGI